MALQTPPTPSPADETIEAGVIEDARLRQRRHRLIGAALIAVLIAAVGLTIGLSGGGGGGQGGSGRTNFGHSAGAGGLGPHVTIGSPSAAALAGVLNRCNGQARRYSHSPLFASGTKLPYVTNPFTTHRTLTAGAGKYVGLISFVHSTLNVCAAAFHNAGRLPGLGVWGVPPAAPAADKLSEDGLSGSGALGGTETWAYGRAGIDVTSVTFVLAHGPAVRAKLENGWYMAWWSGMAGARPQVASVRVTTRSGTVSSPMIGSQCTDHASSCVFVSQPRSRLPHGVVVLRPKVSVQQLEAAPTLQQMLDNFAVLRRPQTAADRSWQPQCDCGNSTRQVNKLTRLAASLPGGYRVFLDIQKLTAGSPSNTATGAYELNLDIVNRSGDSSSTSFGPNTQYAIEPLSFDGPRAVRSQSPLSDVYASLVSDGVASVTWTFRCPKVLPARYHCTGPHLRKFTVPVVNNVAAARLPLQGMARCLPCTSSVQTTWSGASGQVVAAFGGYGNLPAPPFVVGEVARGTQRVLTATAVAGARLGKSSSDALKILTRLLGPAADTNIATQGCGIDHETIWTSPAVADPLTVYDRDGRFVGYQYGAPVSEIGLKQGPGAVLETQAGLTLGDTVRVAGRLYTTGFSTRLVSTNEGRWNVTTDGRTLFGFAIPNDYPARTVAAADPVATIDAGVAGCLNS